MIARLRGLIEEKGRDHLILDVNGVGYRVFVPGSTLVQLGATGSEVKLRIFHYVKEDIRQLYGFLVAEEQEAFEKLISVTGIGPRSALSFLTQLSPSELVDAIAARDIGALAKVKGVGRKTAERVAMELQGKLSPSTSGSAQAAASGGRSALPVDDLVEALLSYGFTTAEVQATLPYVPAAGAATLEERVLLALRANDRLRG